MEIQKKPNKCKIDFKKRGNKIVLSMKGYCDDKNSNQIVNREIEFPDFDKLEDVFN